MEQDFLERNRFWQRCRIQTVPFLEMWQLGILRELPTKQLGLFLLASMEETAISKISQKEHESISLFTSRVPSSPWVTSTFLKVMEKFHSVVLSRCLDISIFMLS